MNAYDLIDALGEINPRLVAEAQRHREAAVRHRSPWKILLVAAIMALLLTGCAVVYALRLETMKVGVMEFPVPNATEVVQANILSLQGIQGSPNHSAAREWFDFRQSYQQTLGAQPLTEEEERRYISYACYDRTMADKLDEICEKYGLQLHGEWFHEIDMKQAYEFLGIPGILAQVPVESYGRGMFFQDGSFRVEGGFTPADCPWPHPVSYSYQYVRKDVFDDVVRSVRDGEDFEQWIYQTDGGEVLLVLGTHGADIYADQDEGFVTVGLTNDDYPTPFSMEKEELEAVARLFDFTIRPQPLDEAETDAARQLQDAAIQARMAEDPERVDSYEEYAKNYLRNRPMTDVSRVEYALRDMNGDGTEELVIFYDRMVSDIVTMENGKTRWFGGNGRPWVWCEGDFFIDRFNYGDYGGDMPANDAVIIRRFEGTKKIDVRQFEQFDGQQWKEQDPFTDLPIADLSDEEFDQIMASYPPLDLNTLNLKPLQTLANSQ